MRANKDCINDHDLPQGEALDCKMGIIRRTIWDGSQELGEIQMPGNGTTAEIPVNALPDDSPHFENDVADVLLSPITASGQPADRNPFYGRVVYTHGPGLDQPLAVFRMGYTFALDSANFAVPAPQAYGLFTINPFWDRQGDAVLGAYSDGKAAECRPVSGHSRQACVHILWPGAWAVYDRQRYAFRTSWHGSLLESKRDPSGLQYRRNRFYDPTAGRFTQEDPIGLAGGINLYGFASGDPVNFSDPFGLWPCGGFFSCLGEMAAMQWRGFLAGSDPTGLTPFGEGQGQLGYGIGKASILLGGAGRMIVGGNAVSGSGLAGAAAAAENSFISSGRMAHILRRHGSGSTAANAGKFAEGADIPGLVGQAMRSDATLIRPGAGSRILFEHTFSDAIGVNSKGMLTGRLRTVLDPSGEVITAFPF
jgi:RHS repeat-associated protein